jgi:hypothetical protein
MTANLIRIGNSKGVILPSAMLKDMGLRNDVVFEITIHEGRIVLSPKREFAGEFTGPFAALNVPGRDDLWGGPEVDAADFAQDLRNQTERSNVDW